MVIFIGGPLNITPAKIDAGDTTYEKLGPVKSATHSGLHPLIPLLSAHLSLHSLTSPSTPLLTSPSPSLPLRSDRRRGGQRQP